VWRFPMEIPRNILQLHANHRSLAERVYGNRNKNPSAIELYRGDWHSLTGPMYVSFASHFFGSRRRALARVDFQWKFFASIRNRLG
jgi:hypothetical protein